MTAHDTKLSTEAGAISFDWPEYYTPESAVQTEELDQPLAANKTDVLEEMYAYYVA
jgi:hypothetical protein